MIILLIILAILTPILTRSLETGYLVSILSVFGLVSLTYYLTGDPGISLIILVISGLVRILDPDLEKVT